MKIVIEIPRKTYEHIRADGGHGYFNIFDEDNRIVTKAVFNGTPLLKGHGRLIDADELYGDFIDGTEGYDCQTWNRIEIGDIIEYAPTIIEADKENKE